MAVRRSCPRAVTVAVSAVAWAALLGAGPANALMLSPRQPAVAVPPTAAAGDVAGAVSWDRVLTHLPVTASAAAGEPATVDRALRTADGTTIHVEDRSSDPTGAVAASYVSFLGSLPHGSELGLLKVRIVPTASVATACGGTAGDGVLACYADADDTMVVPADATSTGGTSGVTLDYVLAHEYGHHVAAHRSDAPYPSLDFGPKYWASYERICSGTLDGRYAPGDESEGYLENPGRTGRRRTRG